MNITSWFSDFLVNNPLLLLFLVLAIGYPIGQVKWQGVNLGVAAILFVGLAFGSLHPDLKLPEIIYQLGLLLFVYTVGIANGESFNTSFKRHGFRDNLFTLSVLVFLFFATIVLAQIFGLKSTYATGLFVGSLTNTPALA
ncbi:MAG: hypothetical protein K2Q22_15025, partial [Cytophagales bacterium]|nr:hypothetical protein [Cytophagales bacterium]